MAFPLRNQYVANRTLTRMKSRGEPMLLRRISMRDGPEAFKNPADVSADLTAIAAHLIGGRNYLNIGGLTAIGRLVPGDLIVCAGPPATSWRVLTMPATVSTNSDGIPQVDGTGAPTFGATPVYVSDTLAWDNVFPVVTVAFVSGPVMPALALTLDITGVLTLAGGGFTAAGLGIDDVIQIAGAAAPNTALNGVDLTIATVSDPMLTVTGLPGGLSNGALDNVTLTVTAGPDTDVTRCAGQSVSFAFAADVTVYGTVLTYSQMTALGWTEVDGLGLSLAGKGVDPPPKVNDVILLTASDGVEKRSIVQMGRRFSAGVNFLFPVQVK